MLADTKRWVPVTEWQTFTADLFLVEIHHTRHVTADRAAAGQWAYGLQAKALLSAEGRIHLVFHDGSSEIVAEADVVIREVVRPAESRGEPFIPDAETEEGRAAIVATFSDPAYSLSVGDVRVSAISLAELAATPGGAGPLGSLSYDTRECVAA